MPAAPQLRGLARPSAIRTPTPIARMPEESHYGHRPRYAHIAVRIGPVDGTNPDGPAAGLRRRRPLDAHIVEVTPHHRPGRPAVRRSGVSPPERNQFCSPGQSASRRTARGSEAAVNFSRSPGQGGMPSSAASAQ